MVVGVWEWVEKLFGESRGYKEYVLFLDALDRIGCEYVEEGAREVQ